ncbi:MAG: TIGR04372 family glycosyltransferase [Magnetospirillum sp. WYHS-4]
MMHSAETEVELRARLWARLDAEPDSYAANRDVGLYCLGKRNLVLMGEEPLLAALRLGRLRDGEETRAILHGLGHINSLKGRHDLAERFYGLARDLMPTHPQYHFDIGDCRYYQGDPKGASVHYARGLNILEAKWRGACTLQGDNSGRRPLFPAPIVCRAYGEAASKLDVFARAWGLGWIGGFRPVLLAPEAQVSNPELIRRWSGYAEVVSDPGAIAELERRFGGTECHLDYIPHPSGQVLHRDLALQSAQVEWDRQGRPAVLELSEDEQRRGRDELSRLGLPRDAWFAALHVRSAETYQEHVPWSQNKYRNAYLENYLPAIESVTARGGWVVRMGDRMMPPLPAMPRTLDLATHPAYTPWLDVFCLGACRFFFGQYSGPVEVSQLFHVPVVGTDWFPLGTWPRSGRNIFIPKRLRRIADGRCLSIAESLAPPRFRGHPPAIYEEFGLEIVDCSADEIREAVEEMLDRLDGRLAYMDEDERRMAQFRRLADPYQVGLPARVGRRYLERHPELIGE